MATNSDTIARYDDARIAIILIDHVIQPSHNIFRQGQPLDILPILYRDALLICPAPNNVQRMTMFNA
jgi:hypothetical protein